MRRHSTRTSIHRPRTTTSSAGPSGPAGAGPSHVVGPSRRDVARIARRPAEGGPPGNGRLDTGELPTSALSQGAGDLRCGMVAGPPRCGGGGRGLLTHWGGRRGRRAEMADATTSETHVPRWHRRDHVTEPPPPTRQRPRVPLAPRGRRRWPRHDRRPRAGAPRLRRRYRPRTLPTSSSRGRQTGLDGARSLRRLAGAADSPTANPLGPSAPSTTPAGRLAVVTCRATTRRGQPGGTVDALPMHRRRDRGGGATRLPGSRDRNARTSP